MATPFRTKGVAILQITSLVLGKCIIYSEQTDHVFALNRWSVSSKKKIHCAGRRVLLQTSVSKIHKKASLCSQKSHFIIIKKWHINKKLKGTALNRFILQRTSKTNAYRILSQLDNWVKMQGTTGKVTH